MKVECGHCGKVMSIKQGVRHVGRCGKDHQR